MFYLPSLESWGICLSFILLVLCHGFFLTLFTLVGETREEYIWSSGYGCLSEVIKVNVVCVCVMLRWEGVKRRQSRVITLQTVLPAKGRVFTIHSLTPLLWNVSRLNVLDLLALLHFSFGLSSLTLNTSKTLYQTVTQTECSGDAEDRREEASSKDQQQPHKISSSVSNRQEYHGYSGIFLLVKYNNYTEGKRKFNRV